MSGGVIIPTYGRQELLWRCLDSVAALDPAPAYAIVVDGNEEPLPFPTDLPSWLEVVREPNAGPSHARNTGYLEAQRHGGAVVCFLDDDAIAPPDWFGRHLELHAEHPRAGAIGGGVANVYADSPVAEYIHQVVFRPLRRDPGPVRMVPSLNVSYKSACIDQVGFFDETIPQAGGEDVDHCWRVTAAGWEVRYQPDLVVSHHYPTTYRALVRQARMYGRGFCQSRHRQPDLPGSDFVSMPWWRAVAGTAPHVAREAIRTATEVDVAAVPASILREAMFRAAALAERKRLATP